MAKHRNDGSLPPIGLVAGWGHFPVQVAQSIIRDGRHVCCVAITGHASTDLESICDHVTWSGVGKLGGHLRYFRRNGVRQVTMAGKLFKADLLFSGSVWLRHFPDWTCIRTLGPSLVGRNRDARDDSLLLAVTDAYQSAGLDVCPATDFAPELLVKEGMLTGKSIDATLQNDIHAGWSVAKQMGKMDIGQTITIKDGTVIAVEAIEGTDACIERTGQLCRRGGWTLVKVSKPNQDMRFDVPTIGPQTIQRVRDAGGRAIVIEADKTIVVSEQETIATARKAGITIVALRDEQSAIAKAA
ncbi:MAG: UDP-2,3-diacylglucosamine diphosphatase LpxI [Planctomycetota bacterium]